MYYTREQWRQQLIRYFLRELYPVFYPEHQIQAVLQRIAQCRTMADLNRLFISGDFVREERLWQAYYLKRNDLVPPEKRRWRIQRQCLWPQPSWMRELSIDCIKSLLPLEVKQQPITQELYTAIQACGTLKELSLLAHSLTLTKLQEIDAIEQRLKELPACCIVPPPNYTSH